MDQQTFPSGFSKREFVVTTEEEQYPQDIKFECVKDRCALLNSVSPGQRVKVSFDLRGNEYNDRFFVNLTAWKIEQADNGGSSDEEMPPVEEFDEFPPDDSVMPF